MLTIDVRSRSINPLSDFPNIFASLTLDRLLESLIVGLICGIIIGVCYRFTYRGAAYSGKFLQSLIVFTVVTAIVILVIGNNLARAFGLVGTMSVVRFRMAIKDARDIVFVYFSLAAGMAAGVGIYNIAVGAVATISLAVLILSRTGFGSIFKRQFLLEFRYTGDAADDPPYEGVLHSFTKCHKLINVKVAGCDHDLDLAYTVILNDPDNGRQFVQALGGVAGVTNVNFFHEDN